MTSIFRYGLLVLVIATSCQEQNTINFPYEQMEYPQPESFMVVPKVDSVFKARTSTEKPQPLVFPAKSEMNFTRVDAHPNVHEIPQELITIAVNNDSLTKLALVESERLNFIINQAGDTITTGTPIPVEGKVMDIGPVQTTAALKLRFKDKATNNIQYLDVDQGMASSYVFSILEDQNGNLWFGTGLGVSRYDGANFTHYTDRMGFSMVWSMHEDQEGNLWFGTLADGLIKYDGIVFIHFTESEGLLSNAILAIEEDRKGNLWIGSASGLSRYDGENFTHYTLNEGLMDGTVNAIEEDEQGNLWLGTEEGVIRFNDQGFVQYTEKNGLSNNSVISILEDSQDNLWFGTDGGGVNKFDGKAFVHYSTREGLSYDVVRSIQEDDQGNLWFSTDGGGTNLFDGETFTHFADREGLYVDVYGSCLDRSGNLWLGTNGGGVSRLSTNNFVHYSAAEGLPNSYVYAIEEDKKGNLWIGTDAGGVCKYDGQDFVPYTDQTPNSIGSILEDKEGNLWFGALGGGVSKYDGHTFVTYDQNSGLGVDNILSIAEDTSGNIWFGTDGSGAIKFDGNQFTHYTQEAGLCHDVVNSIITDQHGYIWLGTDEGLSKYDGHTFTNYTPKEGLNLGDVNSIFEDQKGNLWLGSRGSGLCMFDGKTFVHYTEKEGLSFNVVWAVLEDCNHHIWVTTERGLNQLVPTDDEKQPYQIFYYMQDDGLKGLDFFANSICLDRKNQLWLGSGKSLTMLDLNVHQVPEGAPKVFVRQVDINGERIDYQNKKFYDDLGIVYDAVRRFDQLPINLELASDKNHLTFHYTAIDWQSPYDLHYSFILEGLSDSWSEPTQDTKVDYRNIPPGKYIFKVRARGKSFSWSEEASLIFTVLPPWYQTWWSYVSYLVTLILFGYSYTSWRTRNLRRQKKVLEDTVDRRTADLKQSNESLYKVNQLLKKQKEEIQIQAFELEKLNELKSKFYSVVGHDLRSPLTKLFAVVFKIKRKLGARNSEVQKEFAEFDGMFQNFVELLDNVLDWGLIDSNRRKVVLEPECLGEITENVVRLYEPHALNKQIKLSYQTALPEDLKVLMDKGSMEIVIRNLISNAIKFTHENGQITVSTYAENQKAFIHVADTGVGMPEHKLANIFEITEKKRTTGTNGEKGTGLGLKLANDFVLLNEGNIHIKSTLGKGTMITIELPVAHQVKN